MKLKTYINEAKKLEDDRIINSKGLVSLTIEMPINRFKKLESELNIKTMLGNMNPSMNDAELLSLVYISQIRKGKKRLHYLIIREENNGD